MMSQQTNAQTVPEWLTLPGADTPQAVIGTKAFNLSKLDGLGFAVPDCMFIATLHSEFAQFESAESYLASISEFGRELNRILPSPDGWAIRSSATIEDMPGESHAGRFETKFISNETELASAVQLVWDSGKSAGIGAESMGVVVQKLIDADFAGVAFSHDPTGNDKSTVIEGVAGNAARFVDGELAPWRVRLGASDITLPEGLDASAIEEIDRGVQRLADEFGGAVDTEWVLAKGQLYWLQVRPLTGASAREFTIPESQRSDLKGLWVRINHSFAPQMPLVVSLNPGGYFDGPGWTSCLVNNFHYIQQDKAPGESVPLEEFDGVLDEWDQWEQRFEKLYEERQQVDFASLQSAELWRETTLRIELAQEYFENYSDRRFLEIRDRTELRINDLIGPAVEDQGSVTAVVAKLLGQLGSLTEEKQNQLKRLAELRDADRSSDVRETPEWHEFIKMFGSESATPHLFYLPSLQETPDLILEIIEQLRQRSPQADSADDWQTVADSIVDRLSGDERDEFTVQLTRLRRCMLRTENDDYALARCTLLAREVFLECGRRLERDRVVGVCNDIFYLTGPELGEVLANGNAGELASEIEIRRREFELSKLLSPPPMILNGRAMTPKPKQPSQGLVGTPASPGVATGTVLVVNDPFSIMGRQLPENSVIVAPIVTPSLAYSLLGCAALVTEIGGLASHGAIVAREMAIPAVVGVSNARSSLQTGMSVAVDGSKGEIEILGTTQ